MKTIFLFMLACLLAGSVLANDQIIDDIKPGDDYQTVITALGEPDALMKMDSSMWLQYDRGTVKLKDNLVIEANLISPEEAQFRREQTFLQIAQTEKMEAAIRAQRINEGQAVKQARLNDPYFHSLPVERQLSFWRQFQTQYPEVPSRNEYADALSRYEYEQEQLYQQQQQEQKIRDLEDRLSRAEQLTAQREYEQSRVRYIETRRVYVPTPVYYVRPVKQVYCAPSYTPVVYNQGSYIRSSGRYMTSSRMNYRNCTPGYSLAARISF